MKAVSHIYHPLVDLAEKLGEYARVLGLMAVILAVMRPASGPDREEEVEDRF